jgi:hypothetical protein
MNHQILSHHHQADFSNNKWIVCLYYDKLGKQTKMLGGIAYDVKHCD